MYNLIQLSDNTNDFKSSKCLGMLNDNTTTITDCNSNDNIFFSNINHNTILFVIIYLLKSNFSLKK